MSDAAKKSYEPDPRPIKKAEEGEEVMTVVAERKKVSQVTEADVIETALAQIRKRGGFTASNYFQEKPGGFSVDAPGPNVGVTCAIGGVEQAIWLLTDRVVTDARYESAFPANPTAVNRERVYVLYANVMRRLNRLAREARPKLDLGNIEQLTFRVPKKVVVNVFEKALAEARGA